MKKKFGHGIIGARKASEASQEKTDELKAALAHTMAAVAAFNVPETDTVAEGLKRWLALHTIGNKPSSVSFNQENVKFIHRMWPEAINKPVREITEADCITFAQRIAHYSLSRYNCAINSIRSFIPTAYTIPRKAAPHPDYQVPTPEEFDRLLAALDCAHRGQAGLIVRFLAHTGFRINEARQLKWSDVREDHIYAPGEITKNSKPRCVPFIQGTALVLKLLKRGQRRELILPQAACYKAIRYACRLVGLPQYGHHTFRHYFATRCIVSGVDIPTVAKWMGHTDGGVLLLKTYCHLLDEHSMAMAERVRLGGTLSNPASLVSLHAKSPVTHRGGAIPDPSQKVVTVSFPAPAEALAVGGHQ